MMPIVDVSDTSMAASGTTKRISINNILACSPTATLASATITGAATVGTTLGVTGVSTFAAGTALLPALTTTGDTNTGIYYPAADTFAVTTGGTERYRVDSSGNVGVGVTPSAKLDVNGTVIIRDTFSLLMGFGNQQRILAGGTSDNTFLTFSQWTGAAYTERVRLDASGNLLVGKTTSGAFTDGCQFFPAGTLSLGHPNGTGSGAAYSIFAYNGVKTGDITQNGTTGVLYNTVSDYRLKESVQSLIGGLARVNALKPSIYKWKSDGSAGEGFLAHELAEVVPTAVTGEKDAVNEDGSIKTQSVDLSRVVPILVAAIKELSAEVNALKNA
jgi:hypothetical protein